VAVAHEHARHLWFSSERHEVAHHTLNSEACLLSTYEDGRLLALNELRLLLLKELATLVSLGFLDKLGASSDSAEVKSLLLGLSCLLGLLLLEHLLLLLCHFSYLIL